MIDTALRPGFLGLWQGNNTWFARESFSDPRRQGEEIFPLLTTLLANSNVGLPELQGIVVATGPGSFSALRVGLGAAKSLAETLRLPVMGISLLDAAASFAPGQVRLVSMSASRGESFIGLYGSNDCPLSPPQVVDLSTWVAPTSVQPTVWISTAESERSRAAEQPILGLLPAPAAISDLPERLAREGFRRWSVSKFDDPLVLDALYVRREDADGAWTDHKAS